MLNNYVKQLLGENENVLFVARQHWLVLLAKILAAIFLTVALIVLVTLVWRIWLPDNPIVFLGCLLLLLPLVSMLRNITSWANRQYIITNWRVIQIAGVFSKDVTDSSLEKVNDVKLEQSVWGRLFDYGDIEILTASDLGVNKFRQVGQPIRFKTAMLNAKEKLEQSHAGTGQPLEPDVVDLIAQLDTLRKQGVLTEEEFQQKKAKLLAKL